MKFAFWTYNTEIVQNLTNNKFDSSLQNKVGSANYYAKISTVPTNSVSLHTVRKIFIYLLTLLTYLQ